MDNIILRTGFAAVTHKIEFDKQKINKGEALALSHVNRVEELEGFGNSRVLKASVIRTTSVTEYPYKVELELDGQRMVTNASCNCVSGVGRKCKHIYALIHYVNTDRSCSKTSVEREWGKPTDAQLGKDMYAKPLVVADTFKMKELVKGVKPYNITYSDVQSINCPLKVIMEVQCLNLVKLFIRTVIKDILSAAINKSELSILEACALSLVNLSNSNNTYLPTKVIMEEKVQEYYDKYINISENSIVKVCMETVDQSENRNWFKIRRLRISASSKAHAIKSRSKKLFSALVDDFLNNNTKKVIASLEYGLKHEKEAINEYVLHTKTTVHLVGVFIMPLQPWICASPDAVVIEHDCVSKVLEIKCPSSCQYKPVYDENTGKFNVVYLYLENGIPHLRKSHQYYTQCQMLMYATGLNLCDLFVWSSKGSCLVIVDRDESFLQNIVPKINEFYFVHYLSAICDQDSTVNKENS